MTRARAFALAAAAFAAWTAGALALDTWGARQAPSGHYDAIIVAGCRVDPDGSPSPALEWRVRKAVALWQAGAAPRLVFTGGLGAYPPTEAGAAATFAAALGVPREVMLLEGRSTSTEENAANAAAVLPAARVLVVTDAYHVFRARRVFDRHFGEVDAVGSTYGVASRVRGAYREVLAVAKYGLFGEL